MTTKVMKALAPPVFAQPRGTVHLTVESQSHVGIQPGVGPAVHSALCGLSARLIPAKTDVLHVITLQPCSDGVAAGTRMVDEVADVMESGFERIHMCLNLPEHFR